MKMAQKLVLQKIALVGGIRTVVGTEHRLQSYTRLPIAFNKNEVVTMLLLPTLPTCVIFGMNFRKTFSNKPVCCTISLGPDIEDNPQQVSMKSLSEEEKWRLEETTVSPSVGCEITASICFRTIVIYPFAFTKTLSGGNATGILCAVTELLAICH